uniref:Mitochondrial import receptor subunit TOM7 homolog n=1 Tax=Strongyloides papillosus TaxID=174720 RepID=A0A0N5CEG4_STREA
MQLSPKQKNILNTAGTGIRLAVQYGFVPLVIYIGLSNVFKIFLIKFILGIRNGPDPLPNGEVIPITVMSLFWG